MSVKFDSNVRFNVIGVSVQCSQCAVNAPQLQTCVQLRQKMLRCKRCKDLRPKRRFACGVTFRGNRAPLSMTRSLCNSWREQCQHLVAIVKSSDLSIVSLQIKYFAFHCNYSTTQCQATLYFIPIFRASSIQSFNCLALNYF